MRIKDDPRFPLELRNTSIGALAVEPVSISIVALQAVPVTASGTYSQTEVQAIADAIRELSKIALGE
jgi:hypothetical protein